MALPARSQEQRAPVSGDPPSATLLPQKALLPDLVRLLRRSRQRDLEDVGATPEPTIENQNEQIHVSQSHNPDRFYRQEPKTFATPAGKEITRTPSLLSTHKTPMPKGDVDQNNDQ